ncbi:P1 family peptidase [uncultured Oscillibacter sp.]|uniref:DmpA family aminopeptidase n=3 Tax=uncultured Oscillibacter sp. TaxID=876091 RepID=UPI0026E1CF68|nr:P1 family peptidase [uncultured Oscillibacter sp.]
MGIPEGKLGISFKWKSGPRNLITDVPGVKVGHATIRHGEVNTGVTAILPHERNLFQEKVMAGAAVINGFGKSAGLVQIEELGTIESPIILTNTLSTGTALTAIVKYMMAQNPDIGVKTGTVNCLVTECNDGRLNDIRGLHVTEEHVLQAVQGAAEDFEEGAVGGGTGMVCLGLKGGIGSASRQLEADGRTYTTGALVMSNFGAAGNLVIGGRRIDTRKCNEECGREFRDSGSIIIIIGTDVPLNERQLKRVAKRAMISLGRVGSYCGNGSGDIAIAFTTANNQPHYSDRNIWDTKMFYDENIDCVFEAAVEAVEEAIISSLYHAKTTVGVRGNQYMGLLEFLEKYEKE